MPTQAREIIDLCASPIARESPTTRTTVMPDPKSLFVNRDKFGRERPYIFDISQCKGMKGQYLAEMITEHGGELETSLLFSRADFILLPLAKRQVVCDPAHIELLDAIKQRQNEQMVISHRWVSDCTDEWDAHQKILPVADYRVTTSQENAQSVNAHAARLASPPPSTNIPVHETDGAGRGIAKSEVIEADGTLMPPVLDPRLSIAAPMPIPLHRPGSAKAPSTAQPALSLSPSEAQLHPDPATDGKLKAIIPKYQWEIFRILIAFLRLRPAGIAVTRYMRSKYQDLLWRAAGTQDISVTKIDVVWRRYWQVDIPEELNLSDIVREHFEGLAGEARRVRPSAMGQGGDERSSFNAAHNPSSESDGETNPNDSDDSDTSFRPARKISKIASASLAVEAVDTSQISQADRIERCIDAVHQVDEKPQVRFLIAQLLQWDRKGNIREHLTRIRNTVDNQNRLKDSNLPQQRSLRVLFDDHCRAIRKWLPEFNKTRTKRRKVVSDVGGVASVAKVDEP